MTGEIRKPEITTVNDAVTVQFENRVNQQGLWPILSNPTTVLQMNLGYLCNQSCAHCHVVAGPARTELMSDEVLEKCIAFGSDAGITQFDLTGGAPEMHPKFKWLVGEINKLGVQVMDRCNLTILSEPGYENLAEFLAENNVAIISSLPHYSESTTDRIRGKSVFKRSIEGLQRLNSLGYGVPGSGLELILVHNPAGAYLPGDQACLEADYMTQLKNQHGIIFNRLIALTNMPVGRFLKFLERTGNLKRYMEVLESAFNPDNLCGLMCRYTISVRWDGTLFDCDFNQCLDLAIGNGEVSNIRFVKFNELTNRVIRCLDHCYGCTAGQGSSCGGAVT